MPRMLLFSDATKALQNICISIINKLIFGHLNSNSSRNKSELLCEQIKCSVFTHLSDLTVTRLEVAYCYMSGKKFQLKF